MKVRFVESKAKGEYASLTDGKIYEVDHAFDLVYDDGTPGGPYYMLVEDDHDEQEIYEVGIFKIVEDGK